MLLLLLLFSTTTTAHNRNCITWASPNAILPPHLSALSTTADTVVCRMVEDSTINIGTYRDHGCRIQGDTHDSSTPFQIALMHDDCRIWWHEQAFNALPLPLMTHYSDGGSTSPFDLGLCLDQQGRLGVVHSGGAYYAQCFPSNVNLTNSQPIAGNFKILGAYNRSAPYIPKLSTTRLDGTEELLSEMKIRYDKKLDIIASLVGLHLSGEEDQAMFLRVTNHTIEHLLEYMEQSRADIGVLSHAGAGCFRFLSSDRFIHDKQGNVLGLHVLRSMLARKVTDARRVRRGASAHPDYEKFNRDGFIMRDMSTMSNEQVLDLLRMVSGYRDDDLPHLVWELRESVGKNVDNNLDLHVDTVAPTWKIWLYAEDIGDEHGPLTYVAGSHAPLVGKLQWLYRASIDPISIGAGSYGSFRMGQYGALEEELLRVEVDAGGVPFVRDEEGVWRCRGCVDDERTFGMLPRRGLVGGKLTLVVADTSGLHARGLSEEGKVRRTFILHGHGTDGGLPRVNPFEY